ncbi:hypothetical protein FRX31_006299, partial [Thalictrum thalictroides]
VKVVESLGHTVLGWRPIPTDNTDVHVKKIFKFCQAILFSSCFSENLASFFQLPRSRRTQLHNRVVFIIRYVCIYDLSNL